MLARPGLLLALLNAGVGSVLLLGGPARHTGPAFTTPRDLMPLDVWGVLFLLAAAVCAAAASFGRSGALLVGLGAGLHGCWSTAFLTSALNDERAALTGIVVYAWLALLHITVAARLGREAG